MQAPASKQIVSELLPQISKAQRWVEICQVASTPRTVIEAGIAELWMVHHCVVSAVEQEEVREALLPEIHERFLQVFRSLGSEAGLGESELIDLISRRLPTYGSLMDKSLPNWQYRLSEQVYEGITGKHASPALPYALGVGLLTFMKATAEFLKKVYGRA